MFQNIKEDLRRLSSDGGNIGLRTFFRGVLSQGFQAIMVYRFFKFLKRNHIPGQPFRFIFERFIEMTTGISIPVDCTIGKGFRIHHFGGIIFHPSVALGDHCTLYHDVTIGDAGGYGNAAKVGDHVMIGAGAKIIGEVTIGNHCKIGANAVVNMDVPEGAICYGNPCIIKMKDRE